MNAAQTLTVDAAPPRRRLGLLGKIALIAAIGLAPIATAAIGYYLGTQAQTARPVSYPTWTDQEIRSLGNGSNGTLHCTYHLADGTVRIVDTVIVAVPIATTANTRVCP